MAVIADPNEAQAALAWLKSTMHRRTTQGNGLPHIFCFLDDLLNLLALVDVTGEPVELASLGRAAGIHLIIGTLRLWLQPTGAPVPKRPERRGIHDKGPSQSGAPVRTPLAMRPPNAAECAFLRQLHAELGSKNKTLQAAYGHAGNRSGKSSQTLAWLNRALEAQL